MSEGKENYNDYLNMYLVAQRKLAAKQRAYKDILSYNLTNRQQVIREASMRNQIENAYKECDELRAKVWVAGGSSYMRQNKRHLDEIKCQITCQENLMADIADHKITIQNLEREISKADKRIYELNRKTVPDTQYQVFVAKARKRLSIFENELEGSVRRECAFTAENAVIRDKLKQELLHRANFNEIYNKLVHKLNGDKNYLLQLIEYALNTFESCIEVHEKIDNMAGKQKAERTNRRNEIQAQFRSMAMENINKGFLTTKGAEREMGELDPKELRRREKFRRDHTRKIALYQTVLQRLMDYTQAKDIDGVIARFNEQESLYYSYFKYCNEMSYHLTLLNNSTERLFGNIEDLKQENRTTLEQQIDKMDRLEKLLMRKRERNNQLAKKENETNKHMQKLVDSFREIVELANVDASPLLSLLGQQKKFDLVNMQGYLKLLEKRISGIVASVYVRERVDGASPAGGFVVRLCDKLAEPPTDLDDIVLAQQCPECAEGEAVNDGEDTGITGAGVAPVTITQVREMLHEKVQQPEMQYRLHSLSNCRLPRSRILVAKRNG